MHRRGAGRPWAGWAAKLTVLFRSHRFACNEPDGPSFRRGNHCPACRPGAADRWHRARRRHASHRHRRSLPDPLQRAERVGARAAQAGVVHHRAGQQGGAPGRRAVHLRCAALPGGIGHRAGGRSRAGGLVRRAVPLYPPGYRPGNGRHPGGRKRAVEPARGRGCTRGLSGPHRCAVARRHAAPGAALGQPAGHPGAGTAGHARDLLPPALRSPGAAPARDRGARQPGPSRDPRDRMAEPQLRRAAAHRGTGAAGQPQQLDVASPFQGAHLDEPAAVPEAAAPAGGAAAADRRGTRCVQRRLPGRLRKPLAVQP